jgi:hypothetical protein
VFAHSKACTKNLLFYQCIETQGFCVFAKISSLIVRNGVSAERAQMLLWITPSENLESCLIEIGMVI